MRKCQNRMGKCQNRMGKCQNRMGKCQVILQCLNQLWVESEAYFKKVQIIVTIFSWDTFFSYWVLAPGKGDTYSTWLNGKAFFFLFCAFHKKPGSRSNAVKGLCIWKFCYCKRFSMAQESSTKNTLAIAPTKNKTDVRNVNESAEEKVYLVKVINSINL